MRYIPAVLCSAALIALGFVAATPGVATAALDAAAPAGGMMVAGRTATLNGVIKGAPGVNLNCGSTTAEVHSNGKLIATVPTTSNGAGGCAFSTKVPANIALSSCAGRVALGAANEMGASRAFTFQSTQRSVVNGHERIGTLGSKNVFSTVSTLGSLNGGATQTTQITVGTE